MTQHLREVRKNIQNRWSAGSPPGALGEVGPEGQHLLSSSAQDTPPDCGAGSPVPAPRLHGQHGQHAVAAFPPSNAQLQRVIADALLREQQQQQSKVLSTTTSATNLHQPRQTTSTSSYFKHFI